MEEKDAVIVGARCAGSTLAIALAEQGWDVLVIDRDTFPSETVSTHFVFPNTLARLSQLGVLDRVFAEHDVPTLGHRLFAFGHDLSGGYTPIDGFDRSFGPRRSVLDKAIVDTAQAAGAEGRFGERVVDLIGSGTEEDPVAGVVLDNGDEVRAKWVFGADGRGSTVAGKLGIEKERPKRGEIGLLFAYWRGIPDNGHLNLHVTEKESLYHWAIEDGLYIMVLGARPDITKGSTEERERTYLELLRRFPETMPHDLLDQAEMVTPLTVAPETMLRGYFRRPTGPGWALLGDACHFKHPATAQGISDAVEQAIYIAGQLSTTEGSLDDYETWRDARAAEHYDWSFAWGHLPRRERSEPVFRGWASDSDAGQDLRDTFSRRLEPSQLLTPERMGRWFADDAATQASSSSVVIRD
jgi:2-polyprenyl-6-methoxyphenol hydroxylase-like FAD-dependent oxidoreductase